MGLCLLGCNNQPSEQCYPISQKTCTFRGDSIVMIHSSNRPNGYAISIMKSKDLCLWHFQRGDTLNRYLSLYSLPSEIEKSIKDSMGVFERNFEIPVSKNTILDGDEGSFLFKDVNFDGEEEFLVKYDFYNHPYYVCYDLVYADDGFFYGFLHPIEEKPCNALSCGIAGETLFDYEKKEIHITEYIGCCEKVETWAKPVKYENEYRPKVRIVKRKDAEIWANGELHTEIYELIKGTLQRVSHQIEANVPRDTFDILSQRMQYELNHLR